MSLGFQKRFLVIVTGFSLMGAGSALADDTNDTNQPEVKAKASDELPKEQRNQVPGADVVDDLITNNNLRALSGSTSRWSIASTFNYNGGTLDEPLAQDRPNIANGSGTTTKADLDGSLSAKYNLSPTNALMAGFGVRWIAPFSTGSLNNYNGTTVDVMNPYLQYQYIYKWLGVQSVLQVQGMYWTQADFTTQGYAEQLSVDQENMYPIGQTRLSVGTSIYGQYQFFNKSGAYGSPDDPSYVADIATVQSVYEFIISPELEFQISSKINLRTLIELFNYEHYASASAGALVHDTIYQSFGVGVSVTRDIFLYPNIQFVPANLQSSVTNVGLTANINVF